MYNPQAKHLPKSDDTIFNKILTEDTAAIQTYIKRGGFLENTPSISALIEFAAIHEKKEILAILIKEDKDLPEIFKMIYLGDIKGFQEAIIAIEDFTKTLYCDYSILSASLISGQHQCLEILMNKNIEVFKAFHNSYRQNKLPKSIIKAIDNKVQLVKNKYDVLKKTTHLTVAALRDFIERDETIYAYCVLLNLHKIAKLDSADELGNGSLHYAAFTTGNGNIGLVKLLLSFGVSVNMQTKYGQTPLMAAAETGKTALIEVLITTPNIAFTLEDENQYNALLWAVDKGHLETSAILIRTGAFNLEKKQCDGLNALHLAIIKNVPSIVQLLVDAGADVNARTAQSEQSTALQIACESSERIGIVRILLEKQSLDYHAETIETEKTNALLLAAYQGGIETLRLLLDTGKYRLSNLSESESWRLLRVTIHERFPDRLRLLLQHGANPNISITDKKGVVDAPIKLAIGLGYEDIVEILLQDGKVPIETAIFPSKISGDPPISLLAASCCTPFASVVETLIRAGADITVTIKDSNNNSRGMLSIAAEKGHINTLAILVKTMREQHPSLLPDQLTWAISCASQDKKFDCLEYLLKEKFFLDFHEFFSEKYSKNLTPQFISNLAEALATPDVSFLCRRCLHCGWTMTVKVIIDNTPNADNPELCWSQDKFEKYMISLLETTHATQLVPNAKDILKKLWDDSPIKTEYERIRDAREQNKKANKLIDDARALSQKFQAILDSDASCHKITQDARALMTVISTDVASIEAALKLHEQTKTNSAKRNKISTMLADNQRRLETANSVLADALNLGEQAHALEIAFEAQDQDIVQTCTELNLDKAAELLKTLNTTFVKYLGIRKKLTDHKTGLTSSLTVLKTETNKADKQVAKIIAAQQTTFTQTQIKHARQVMSTTETQLEKEQEIKITQEKTTEQKTRQAQYKIRQAAYEKIKTEELEKTKRLNKAIQQEHAHDASNSNTSSTLPYFYAKKAQPFPLNSATCLSPRLSTQDELLALKAILENSLNASADFKKTLEHLKIERNAQLGALGRTFEFAQQLPTAFKLPDDITTILRNFIFHGEELKPKDEQDLKQQAELNTEMHTMTLALVTYLQTAQTSAIGLNDSERAKIEHLACPLFQKLLSTAKNLAAERYITVVDCKKCLSEINLGQKELALYQNACNIDRDTLSFATGFTLARLGCFTAELKEHYPDEYLKNQERYEQYIGFGREFRHHAHYPDPIQILANLNSTPEEDLSFENEAGRRQTSIAVKNVVS